MAPDAVMYVSQVKSKNSLDGESSPGGSFEINQAFLFADPQDIEGGLFARAPGRTRGYDTALLASVSYHIAEHIRNSNSKELDQVDLGKILRKAVANGLVASRYLHLRGFTQVYQACASKMSLLSDVPLIYTIMEPDGSLAPQGQTSKGLYYPIDPVGHIIRERDVDYVTWVPDDLLSFMKFVSSKYKNGGDKVIKFRELTPLLVMLVLLSKSLSIEYVCEDNVEHHEMVCEELSNLVNKVRHLGIIQASGQYNDFVLPRNYDVDKRCLELLYNGKSETERAELKKVVDENLRLLLKKVKDCCSKTPTLTHRQYYGWLDKLRKANRSNVQTIIRDLMVHVRSDFKDADQIRELEIPLRIIQAVQSRRIGLERECNPISKRLLHQGYFDSTWWSFLGEEVIREAGIKGSGRKCEEDVMMEMAESYLKKGSRGLSKRSLVRAEYGKFISYNRAEIEGIRNVAATIRTYLERGENDPKSVKPLNLAVFGPPGAGKGFAVNAVIRSLSLERIAKEELTFNVSQFKDPSEIFQALHAVRDVAIKGKVPLVFWDEYDTTLDEVPFGWLRYFIGPMWDGFFQEGQIRRPIGQAIFVFAGSRFTSQLSLEAGLILDRENLLEISGDMPQELRLFHEFKAAKGLDFKSRLLGYLDIMDVNPTVSVPEVLDYAQLVLNRQQTSDTKHVNMRSDYGLGRHLDPGWRDYYLLRRALQLRFELASVAPMLFNVGPHKDLNIETAVQNAFLRARRYHHGARSLSAIVQMSNLKSLITYDMSALPGGEQMRLHVEPSEFESSYEDFE